MRTPASIEIFSIKGGAANCSFLKFFYSDGTEKHLLVDLGREIGSKSGCARIHYDAAKFVQFECRRSLDVLIAMPRVNERYSGLAMNSSGCISGDVIQACNPGIILHSWKQEFENSLKEMQAFSAALSMTSLGKLKDKRFKIKSRNRFASQSDNACAKTDSFAALLKSSHHVGCLSHGKEKDLSGFIPGVEVIALSSETGFNPENPDGISDDAGHEHGHGDNGQLWRMSADRMQYYAEDTAKINEDRPMFKEDDANKIPAWAHWGIRKIESIQQESMLGMIGRLQNSLSLRRMILIFKIGEDGFIFPTRPDWSEWGAVSGKAETQKIRKVVDDNISALNEHDRANRSGSFWHRIKDIMNGMPIDEQEKANTNCVSNQAKGHSWYSLKTVDFG